LQAATGGITLAAMAALSGCATLDQFTAEVATFGSWPAGRQPGTYAFERLPSQQSQAEAMQQLEDAAAPALERAGFRPAAPGATPDVLVQVGLRISRADLSPWDDPLWWHGGFGTWRHGPWRGPVWGVGWRGESRRYDREVALLLRDRASGAALFEARASSESFQRSAGGVLVPLFAAAMTDFPATGVNPRQVTVPLAP
jgi:hypothetical protein